MVRSTRSACCSFVPPHVTDHLARSSGLDTPDPSAAQRTAVLSQQIRRLRETAAPDLPSALTAVVAPRPGKGDRAVYDDENTANFDVTLVRGEADPAVSAKNVNQAYDYAGAARDYYKTEHGRDSIDHNGMAVTVNVTFDVDFNDVDFNSAFWDGQRLVMGNGDGQTFVDFAGSPDVMGHELSHGVVEFTANLQYKGQSGALNESRRPARTARSLSGPYGAVHHGPPSFWPSPPFLSSGPLWKPSTFSGSPSGRPSTLARGRAGRALPSVCSAHPVGGSHGRMGRHLRQLPTSGYGGCDWPFGRSAR
jgi:hypothetical protein